jgi:hypothetical protein
VDNCFEPRTVPNCGDCTYPETCGGGGVSGGCGIEAPAGAPPDTNTYDLTQYNPLPNLSFSRLLCTIANWIISLGLIVVVLMIAIAGIILLTSRDKEEQRRRGKKALETAIVGLLILLLAKGIIIVILAFLGVPLLSMTC